MTRVQIVLAFLLGLAPLSLAAAPPQRPKAGEAPAAGGGRSSHPPSPRELRPWTPPDIVIQYARKNPFSIPSGSTGRFPDRYDYIFHAAIAHWVAERETDAERKKRLLERIRWWNARAKDTPEDYHGRFYPVAMARRLSRLLELDPGSAYSAALKQAVAELRKRSSLFKDVEAETVPPMEDEADPTLGVGANVMCPPGSHVRVEVKTLPRVTEARILLSTGATIRARRSSTGATTAYRAAFLVTRETTYAARLTDRDGVSTEFGWYDVRLPLGLAPVAFAMGEPQAGLSLGIAAHPKEADRLLVRFHNSGKAPLMLFWHRSASCPLTVLLKNGEDVSRFPHRSLGRSIRPVRHEAIELAPAGHYDVDIRLSDFVPAKASKAGTLQVVYRVDERLAPRRIKAYQRIHRGPCHSGLIDLGKGLP